MAAFNNQQCESHVKTNGYTPKIDLTNQQDDGVRLCKTDQAVTRVSALQVMVAGSLMDGRMDALALTQRHRGMGLSSTVIVTSRGQPTMSLGQQDKGQKKNSNYKPAINLY